MNLYCKRCADKMQLSSFISTLAYRTDVEILQIIVFEGQFTVNYTAPLEIW